MKRYTIETLEHEDSHGDLVHYSDVRRFAREINRLADEIPNFEKAGDWLTLQDRLHMIAKSILGEH